MCEQCGDASHFAHSAADRKLSAALSSRRQFVATAMTGAALLGASTPLFASKAFGQVPTPSAPSQAMADGYPAVGYIADGTNSPLHRYSFTRRNLRADDVLIDILYSGVCHSDIHTVNGDWGQLSAPTIPGHEILGRVAAVGSSVSKFKVGDVAGVGCLVNSCGQCEYCRQGLEQYCSVGATFTYNSKDENGQQTQGGYANKIVVKESFVIKLPEKMNVAAAAPLLCAGVTTFSPMQHWNVGPEGKVGVVGLGGLGHMAVKIFKARGNDVTIFTTSENKIGDAQRLGASGAVLWSDKAEFDRLAGQFDFLLTTVPRTFELDPFVNLLKVGGTIVNVGDLNNFDTGFNNGALAGRRKQIGGSLIGGIAETQEIIDYCASRNILADVEVIPIEKINEAWRRVVDKDVRYRFVIDMSTLHA
ncbi:NAD(P)-dependent alcohol dehydrogenase [Agrobacterium rubi]|uniref:NAD(P)-dependent alcohol dehydrogenase n=2 Tax=Rhizobium/Agrobacterium group TaxID=227290 RepID=A0AAE7RCX1_9HYPH|nr:NAD(P)-dependent alcohol dehydrogenase [Agrobacterium rubi]NTF05365.1 NAD(P)-dependent alcohol dehydrogenase [Agrobacterium rubi]NTF39809.1 NAD(P)-dependent alcohol dehydrogenase [Agrobacterium rubi]QTG03352.1 NAD(P)-dependent alcohol dehydrogenase [Agrobacterium rubi]